MISETDTIYDLVKRDGRIRTRLLELSPKFARLNNPVIFNTVAGARKAKVPRGQDVLSVGQEK